MDELQPWIWIEEFALIDNEWNIIQLWDLGDQDGSSGYNSNIYPDISLLVDKGNRYNLYDINGNLTWALFLCTPVQPGFYNYHPNTENKTLNRHHDSWIIPGGLFPDTEIGDKLILAMGSHFLNAEEAWDLGRNPEYGSSDFESGFVHILKINEENGIPTEYDDLGGADILWEWYMTDHFVQDLDPSKENYVDNISNHPNKININLLGEGGLPDNFDFTHLNTIHYNPHIGEMGSIVISSRTMGDGEWFVIDIETGNIIFRCCNPPNWGVGDQSDRITNHQHSALWIPEGYPYEGEMIFFNNDGTPSACYPECQSEPTFGYCCMEDENNEVYGQCGSWGVDYCEQNIIGNGPSQVIKLSPTYDGSMNYEITGIIENVNPPSNYNHDGEIYPQVFQDDGSFWMGAMGGTFPFPNGNVALSLSQAGLYEVTDPWNNPTLTWGAQATWGSTPYPWNPDPDNLFQSEGRMVKYVCDTNSDNYWHGLTIDCSLLNLNEYELGDINQDYNIDVLDIIYLVNIIIDDNWDSLTEAEMQLADINGDGVLDILDVITILNMILNTRDITEREREKLTDKLTELHQFIGSKNRRKRKIKLNRGTL